MKAFSSYRVSAIAAALATFASRVGAQTAADKAAAEALFDQGRAAMQEGDFGKACGLLERSQHTDPGVGTLLYLAECYEKSGRTASAWATFREAADAADHAKEPARARTGRDRAAKLEPHLSRLTIQVPPEAQQVAGLSIARGGQAVQPPLWNVPVPVDPAEYAITAAAPGYESWSGSVSVPERAAKVLITVPPLKKSPESDKAPTPLPAQSDATQAVAPAPTDGAVSSAGVSADKVGSAQRTFAYLFGGAGVVGIGIGAFFGLRAFSKNNDAKTHCPAGYQCKDAQGPALADDARAAARISNIAFSAGGAALAGGAILYFTSPRGGAVNYAVGPTGFTIWGSFQ